MAEQLRAATELLETVARDRGLLGSLTVEERTRLLKAAADVFNPDVVQRRRFTKAKRKEERGREHPRRRGEARRHRHPRAARAAGLHDAERLPAEGVRARGPSTSERARDGRGAALLRLQAALPRAAPLLRPALPAVRRLQLRQALRDRRPRGPRRAAHRRPRQDRLPGRDQAAARRRAPDRDDALPARRGGPLRAGGRLRRLGRPARDLRPRPAPHAERRGVLPPPLDDARPPRLHRQQRLPDGAAAAGLLPPHAGRRARVRAHARARGAAAARRLRRGCAATTCSRARSPCSRPRALGARRRPGELGGALPGAPPARRRRPTRAHLFPEGRLDQDLQQVDLRDRNSWRFLLARGLDGGAARDAARQRRRPVRAQRAAQAADAAHGRPRQAHRQRLGDGGPVLPALQDHPPPAHEHGQGGAEHDDPHRPRPTTTATGST